MSSALHADVSVLYSEDMPDGLVVENRMRIINPLKGLQPTGEQSGGSGAEHLSGLRCQEGRRMHYGGGVAVRKTDSEASLPSVYG